MGYIGAGPTRFNTADELTVTGDAEFNGNLTVKGTTTTIDSVTVQNFDMGDNDRIRIGDSQDLQIYHNGLASVISDVGTGNFFISGDNDVFISKADLSGVKAKFSTNGAVTLYYNNSPKLATTNTGVDVTGTVVTDGFELNTIAIGGDTFGVVKSANNTAAGFDFFGDSSGTKGARVYYEGNGNLFTIAENTSGTIEPRLVIDDSGKVGIGTSSPAKLLSLQSSTQYEGIRLTNGTNTVIDAIGFGAGNDAGGIKLYNGGTANVQILSSSTTYFNGGNVGIGTTSPSTDLHVLTGEANTSFGSVYIQQNAATNAPTLYLHQVGQGGNNNVNQGLLIKLDGNNNGTGKAIRVISTNSNLNGGVDFDAFTVENRGNVGIGTSSPNPDYGSDTALEISGATSPGIVINDTGQASKYGIHADSNDLKITYGAGALATFQNDGKVGIGTSSPTDAKLVIDGGSDSPLYTQFTDDNNGATNNIYSVAYKSGLNIGNKYSGSAPSANGTKVAKIQLLTVTNGGYGAYGQIICLAESGGYNAGALAFATGSNSSGLCTERLRIDSSGRVTTPYQPAFNAHVGPSTQTSGTIVFSSTRFNVGSHYNTSTGVFTAPVAGVYVFNWQVYKNNGVTNATSILFQKNGADLYEGLATTTSYYASIDGGITINMSANDTAALVVRQGTIHTNYYFSGFSGCLIG